MIVDGLVEALQAAVGTGQRRVVGADASLSPYSSSFRIEDVTVDFVGGEREHLVLKDLSWGTMLEGARAVRTEATHDPCREVDVYRNLLSRAPSGPPRLLGWLHRDREERHWLFLEKVDGLQLRHVGELETWRHAARWVGEFHARFREPEDLAAAGLPEWTAHRLRQSLRTAEARVSGHGDRRARRTMARVRHHHATAVPRLEGVPVTLIHGQLYPSNVLVVPGSPPRISPLDWETAAVGPGVLDLAALVEGTWDETARDALCRAYLEGRDGAGGT